MTHSSKCFSEVFLLLKASSVFLAKEKTPNKIKAQFVSYSKMKELELL